MILCKVEGIQQGPGIISPLLLPELCSVGALTGGTAFTLKGKEDKCKIDFVGRGKCVGML